MYKFEVYCPVKDCGTTISIEHESPAFSGDQADQLHRMMQDHFALQHSEGRTIGKTTGAYCAICRSVVWFSVGPRDPLTNTKIKRHMVECHSKEAKLMQLMGGMTFDSDLPVFRQPGNSQVLFPSAVLRGPIQFWPKMEITREERLVIALQFIEKNCCDELDRCRGGIHSAHCCCTIASKALADIERIQDGKLPFNTPEKPETNKERKGQGREETPEGAPENPQGK